MTSYLSCNSRKLLTCGKVTTKLKNKYIKAVLIQKYGLKMYIMKGRTKGSIGNHICPKQFNICF